MPENPENPEKSEKPDGAPRPTGQIGQFFFSKPLADISISTRGLSL